MNLKKLIQEDVKRQLNEGKNFAEIMKGVNQGSQTGPWTIVVIRNNKVVKQELVNVKGAIPANIEYMKKEFAKSGDLLRIEDNEGMIVYSETVVKLTVKDWDEYSYPKAYVMITLSNNKKLTISPQRIPGGKKAYEDMLRVLRDYNYDKRANDYIDNLISQMA